MATICVQYDPLAYVYSKKESYGPSLVNLKKGKEATKLESIRMSERA